MLQRWRKLTFLHWPYHPDVIRPLIPKGLELDTFDGQAWVGLVPFLVTGLRPPRLPAAPWISEFPETNVRTYVRGPDGNRGVWFFTLEADRLFAVIAARAIYSLPYRWAHMTVEDLGNRIVYQSVRQKSFGRGRTDIIIEPGAPIEKNQLINFVTAQFRLYAARGRSILCAPIEHAPWPLQSARVIRLDEDLILNSGVPSPLGEPMVHYSRDLSVKIGKIEKLD